MEAHYAMLRTIMGLPTATMNRSNVDRTADPSHLDGQIDWDLVMEKNRFDAALYERVQAEGLCGVDLAR